MKVYVVLYITDGDADYRDAYVVGVYQSYEKALELKALSDNYYIDESVLED
jgi:hypothetical protein